MVVAMALLLVDASACGVLGKKRVKLEAAPRCARLAPWSHCHCTHAGPATCIDLA